MIKKFFLSLVSAECNSTKNEKAKIKAIRILKKKIRYFIKSSKILSYYGQN